MKELLDPEYLAVIGGILSGGILGGLLAMVLIRLILIPIWDFLDWLLG